MKNGIWNSKGRMLNGIDWPDHGKPKRRNNKREKPNACNQRDTERETGENQTKIEESCMFDQIAQQILC